MFPAIFFESQPSMATGEETLPISYLDPSGMGAQCLTLTKPAWCIAKYLCLLPAAHQN
jgi:hypothetical protein